MNSRPATIKEPRSTTDGTRPSPSSSSSRGGAIPASSHGKRGPSSSHGALLSTSLHGARPSSSQPTSRNSSPHYSRNAPLSPYDGVLSTSTVGGGTSSLTDSGSGPHAARMPEVASVAAAAALPTPSLYESLIQYHRHDSEDGSAATDDSSFSGGGRHPKHQQQQQQRRRNHKVSPFPNDHDDTSLTSALEDVKLPANPTLLDVNRGDDVGSAGRSSFSSLSRSHRSLSVPTPVHYPSTAEIMTGTSGGRGGDGSGATVMGPSATVESSAAAAAAAAAATAAATTAAVVAAAAAAANASSARPGISYVKEPGIRSDSAMYQAAYGHPTSSRRRRSIGSNTNGAQVAQPRSLGLPVAVAIPDSFSAREAIVHGRPQSSQQQQQQSFPTTTAGRQQQLLQVPPNHRTTGLSTNNYVARHAEPPLDMMNIGTEYHMGLPVAQPISSNPTSTNATAGGRRGRSAKNSGGEAGVRKGILSRLGGIAGGGGLRKSKSPNPRGTTGRLRHQMRQQPQGQEGQDMDNSAHSLSPWANVRTTTTERGGSAYPASSFPRSLATPLNTSDHPRRAISTSEEEEGSMTDSSMDDDLRLALEISRQDAEARVSSSSSAAAATATAVARLSTASQSSFVRDAMKHAWTDDEYLQDRDGIMPTTIPKDKAADASARGSLSSLPIRSSFALDAMKHAYSDVQSMQDIAERTMMTTTAATATSNNPAATKMAASSRARGFPSPRSSPKKISRGLPSTIASPIGGLQSSFARDALDNAWGDSGYLQEMTNNHGLLRDSTASAAATTSGYLEGIDETKTTATATDMKRRSVGQMAATTGEVTIPAGMMQSSRDSDLADLMLALKLSAEESAGSGIPVSATTRLEDLLEFEMSQPFNQSMTDFVAAGMLSTSPNTRGSQKLAATTKPYEQLRILDKIREEQEQRELEMVLKVSEQESQRSSAITRNQHWPDHAHAGVHQSSPLRHNKTDPSSMSRWGAPPQKIIRENSISSMDSEGRRQELLQRGASEIVQAIEAGKTHWVNCGGCGALLQAPISYPLVLCPRCERISPVKPYQK